MNKNCDVYLIAEVLLVGGTDQEGDVKAGCDLGLLQAMEKPNEEPSTVGLLPTVAVIVLNYRINRMSGCFPAHKQQDCDHDIFSTFLLPASTPHCTGLTSETCLITSSTSTKCCRGYWRTVSFKKEKCEFHPPPQVSFFRLILKASCKQIQRSQEMAPLTALTVPSLYLDWCHWLEVSMQPFMVWTDHKNLAYIRTAKPLNSRQASPGPTSPWILSLVCLCLVTVILAIVDQFSKVAHFVALTELPTARETAYLLTTHVVRLHSISLDIVSDWCLQFISQ
ncbi:hypothetical protein L3Q82_023903, partial [Scortum barcoo]